MRNIFNAIVLCAVAAIFLNGLNGFNAGEKKVKDEFNDAVTMEVDNLLTQIKTAGETLPVDSLLLDSLNQELQIVHGHKQFFEKVVD